MKRSALLAAGLLLLVGCGEGWSPTQADPTSPNQAYMVGEMKRIERLMEIGEFVAMFSKPPSPTYAGWANCQPGGGRPPYIVNFNDEYVETLKSETYMTALVAHEMCHHYVTAKGGGCWDEVAAETCAGRYAR